MHEAIESSPGHSTPDFPVLSPPTDRTAADNQGTEFFALRKNVEVDRGARLAQFQHSDLGLNEEFPFRFALCHLNVLINRRTRVESGNRSRVDYGSRSRTLLFNANLPGQPCRARRARMSKTSAVIPPKINSSYIAEETFLRLNKAWRSP